MGERESHFWEGLPPPSAGRALVPVLPSAVPEISQLHLLALGLREAEEERVGERERELVGQRKPQREGQR